MAVRGEGREAVRKEVSEKLSSAPQKHPTRKIRSLVR